MKYSNGFDLDTVLPALASRVGWRSESLVRSFESFHALCTEQNLRDIQPTEGISNTDFGTYKTTLKTDIIQRCLSSVFSKPEYLEQVLLHNKIPGTLNQLVANGDQFVGIRFTVVPSHSISVWVKNITLLFDSSVTFNLYLYQDQTPAPVKTISVTAVANVPTTIALTDLLLSYSNTQCTTFFLGYYEQDLGSAKAVFEQAAYNQARNFAATTFKAQRTGSLRFNQAYTAFSYDTCGLNAEVHAFKDYTGKIIRSAHLFDEAIGLSMVYFLLEQIVSSTRSNSKERILKGAFDAIELKHYLYGVIPAMGVAKTMGLNEIIQQKFLDIRESFFPCPEAQTVSLCS